MRRLFLLIALPSLAIPALGQTKHPFTFEDMTKLKRVGEPEVSPDGKWVILSVVDVDLNANRKTPHVWIVPTAGGQEREIISDQDAARPRWAPDGKRFAFVSSKEGGPQVWVADFDGTVGTVTGLHRLTSIVSGAGGEVWSPDGKNILFVSSVYPECADEACNAKKLEEAAKSKVKAMIFTRLLYRHVNAYNDGTRNHIFVIPADPCVGTTGPGCPAVLALDLSPGDYDVASSFGQDEYAFSPDGQEICYTSNHDKNEATSTNNDLWVVPITGGPAKNITAANLASDSTPLYSLDGKYIAYRAQQRAGYESDRFRLMLHDRKTGEKRNLTEGFDRWVGTFTWAPNSSSIFFVSENEGESLIYEMFLEEVKLLDSNRGYHKDSKILELQRGFSDNLAITADGQTLLYSGMSDEHPYEIYKITALSSACFYLAPGCDERSQREFPLPKEKAQPLTHFNDTVLSRVSLSRLESFWFTGAHGDKVQGFLVKPPNFDAHRKYPVKFFLKGGPQIAWGDLWSYGSNLQLFAADGYVVITINFHGSTGYGQKFIDAVNGDWGGAPFEDQMKGLDYAEKTYSFIDKNRECAIGGSYGGYMANWVLGHTDRFKCIVSHHSPFNLESFWGSTDELWFPTWDFKGTPYDNRDVYQKWSPHLYAENFKTPTLVSHGQLDYRVDVSQALQLFTTLQMRGVPSKLLYFPDEAQYPSKPQNSQLWYKTVNEWVDQWTNIR